ncbi:hypothetical protein [Bhargavaea ginsengi]|nr:hypothetical protein [Bhargavaea ginsengi]MCM3086773.1 hypothetical protein [Bhargavaea ginsengi]
MVNDETGGRNDEITGTNDEIANLNDEIGNHKKAVRRLPDGFICLH